MVDKPIHPPSFTSNDEVQSALATLEENMFIKASELINRVTIAAKDIINDMFTFQNFVLKSIHKK